MNCVIGEKVVYPIAKNRVIGVTKISDDYYERFLELVIEPKNPSADIYFWTLTYDDYLVAVDRFTGEKLINGDHELFCFICY